MLIKCKSLTPPPYIQIKVSNTSTFFISIPISPYPPQQKIPPNKKMYANPKLFDIKKNDPPLEPPV